MSFNRLNKEEAKKSYDIVYDDNNVINWEEKLYIVTLRIMNYD